MDFIEIKGFKSIREARVDLSPINILIGANGSGKSNLLSFFTFLHNLYVQNLAVYVARHGGMDKFLHHGRKKTDALSFQVGFGEGTNAYAAELVAGPGQFIVSKEFLSYRTNEWTEYTARPESRIKELTSFRSRYIREHLESCRRYHFHDTSLSSPFTQPSRPGVDAHYLYGSGSNIPALLQRIHREDPQVYQQIVSQIQSVAPYFLDFYLEAQDDRLALYWRDRFSETIYDATDLSDGTLRFIALAVLFLQPHLPKTIVIDEPELGLHPQAVALLAGMIRSAARRGSQIIAATQSEELISNFQPEDIVTADLRNGATEFNRLKQEDLEEWLEEYSLGNLWNRGIISNGHPNYTP